MTANPLREALDGSSRNGRAGVAQVMHIAEDDRAEMFNRLYRDNADKVYALCLRMSRDSFRATEMAQDVFIRVWRNMSMLREGSDSGAWVWRVAINVALNGLLVPIAGCARESCSLVTSPRTRARLGFPRQFLSSESRCLPPFASSPPKRGRYSFSTTSKVTRMVRLPDSSASRRAPSARSCTGRERSCVRA
jgi:hypothetical protein